MKETQTPQQTQQHEKISEAIVSEIAKKLLSGEALSIEEASLLTDWSITRKLYHYLWHYTMWGW
jgi:hypothetical protein